ncbi:MGH1-like glycoside hydrolase domain-containing protein [Tenacibaculum piscium]|uniref:MGH1-like glycoside hydrolase domain-containing protein n=1 Tax=Tenacibaculum piscium TaxID=1458515 RepID=UPI001F31083C|nr:trehalase family glycosidase [Tenacibaculum piscium]
MIKQTQILVVSLFIILLSCKQKEDKKQVETTLYSNILNYVFTPKHKFDKKGLMFSDQGAWFGYSFPETTNIIGFSGPFLMTQQNGVWSSASLTNLIVKNTAWKLSDTESYSSHLEQTFLSEKLELKQQLVFSSGHTAIIKSRLKNKSNSVQTINYSFKNKDLLADGLKLSVKENNLTIKSALTNAVGHIIFPKDILLTASTDSIYTSNEIEIVLKPNETKEFIISQSFIFKEYSWGKERKNIQNINFDTVLKDRKLEKNTELQSLIKNRKTQFNDHKYAEVLAKTQVTLQNNWRIPAGELKDEGLFPSYHYKWFHGFWSWDSWKHAVGLSYYNTDLAKKQIKAMFNLQGEDGFIVDCIYRDTLIEKHNYRDTKPPLSAWAITKIYKKDKDISFVKEFYPKLKKYHQWWYNKRDHDKDGLCEYGSTDGSLIAAKWESGMDNAIRFDNSEILKNGEGAYSINQESVDLNAYLYAEKLFLSELATILENKKEADDFKKEAKKLKLIIQSQFYDPIDGWFYDTTLDGKTFIKGEGSEGWTALWANAATQEQAKAVKNKMMNPKKFFTKVPFQTMSADHEKFNPLKGYWRGPNWLDQAYFGVKGLRNYGFDKEADKATIQILKGAEGVLGKGKSIRENYHPLTGEGLNAENFSWSAAHIMMLLQKD